MYPVISPAQSAADVTPCTCDISSFEYLHDFSSGLQLPGALYHATTIPIHSFTSTASTGAQFI